MTADPSSAVPPPAPPTEQTSSRRGLLSVVLRGGGWQATGQLAPLIVNILLTPVIISGLGVDRYGLFLLINAVAATLAAADGGIGGAALRYLSIYAGAKDKGSATRLTVTTAALVAAVAMVGAGVFWFVSGPLIRLFHVPVDLESEGVFLLRTLVVITAVGVLRGVLAANLNAHQRFALTSITNNCSYVVYIAGTLVTVHEGWGLYGMACTMMAQQVLTTVLIVPNSLALLDRHAVGWMPKVELRELLRYAMHVQWSNLMLLASLGTDSFIIGAFLPVRQVAYFQTGANFATQIRAVPLNALSPIETVLGRTMGREGADGARAEFEWLQRLWVVGTAGWGVAAMSAAWFGVTAWLGPDFDLAGQVAAVMLLAYTLSLGCSVLNVWAQVQGRPDLFARAASIGVVVNLALTLALIKPFGVLGTVTATAVSEMVIALILLRLARRRLPGVTRSFLREVPLLACLASGVVIVGCELLVRPLIPSGALGLVLSGLVAAPGLVVYVVCVFGVQGSWRLVRHRQLRPPAGADSPAPATTQADT